GPARQFDEASAPQLQRPAGEDVAVAGCTVIEGHSRGVHGTVEGDRARFFRRSFTRAGAKVGGIARARRIVPPYGAGAIPPGHSAIGPYPASLLGFWCSGIRVPIPRGGHEG